MLMSKLCLYICKLFKIVCQKHLNASVLLRLLTFDMKSGCCYRPRPRVARSSQTPWQPQREAPVWRAATVPASDTCLPVGLIPDALSGRGESRRSCLLQSCDFLSCFLFQATGRTQRETSKCPFTHTPGGVGSL